MNKDKQNEIIAKLLLAEYERKEKLKKIIDESIWHYYFGGILKFIIFLFFIGGYIFILACCSPANIPYLFFITLIVFILIELNRHNYRFKALVKILEIEKEENENKSLHVTAEPSCDLEDK